MTKPRSTTISGLGYSLLVLADAGVPAADAIEKAARAAGVPLKRIDLRGKGLEKLYEAPLVLIRPDQYVAWRGSNADAVTLINTIRGIETRTAARRAAS